MGISLKDASEQVGVTRQTLMKAIKNGRVSGKKTESGEWRIDPAELFRVWPPVNRVQQPLQADLTSGDTHGLQDEYNRLQDKVSMLEQLNADLRDDRDAWRDQAQRLALTDQRERHKSGFWGRLFKKGGDDAQY